MGFLAEGGYADSGDACLRHRKLANDAHAPNMNTASSNPTLALDWFNRAWRMPCSSDVYA